MCAERGMASRDKDQTTPHQPLLSSLVIRPADSGAGAGGGGSGGGGAASDYEPGEVRRDPPAYSRNNRYDGHGYRMRAGSVSPVRRRGHHRFSPGFEPSGGLSRSRGLGNGREPGRYRDYSPPYGRGKDFGRFPGRGHDQSARGPGPFRVEGVPRNNPNVRPREGDWICSDPSCKNLNFARRDHCNNCNKPRYASSGGSPRRGYPGPPVPPRQRLPPTPLDHHSPGRTMNGGYNRSPPRGWPRDFRPAGPPTTRFPNPPLVRGDNRPLDYPEDEPRDNRYRYDRPVVPEWAPHRDRGRDNNYFNERRGGYGRRALSPPLAPVGGPRGGWGPHIRDRSRSPVRGGPPQPQDYHHHQRAAYVSRRRDDRRGGVGRDAF